MPMKRAPETGFLIPNCIACVMGIRPSGGLVRILDRFYYISMVVYKQSKAAIDCQEVLFLSDSQSCTDKFYISASCLSQDSVKRPVQVLQNCHTDERSKCLSVHSHMKLASPPPTTALWKRLQKCFRAVSFNLY